MHLSYLIKTAIKGLGHSVFSLGDLLGNDLMELKCFELSTLFLSTGGAPDLSEPARSRGCFGDVAMNGKLVNNYRSFFQDSWSREVFYPLVTVSPLFRRCTWGNTQQYRH